MDSVISNFAEAEQELVTQAGCSNVTANASRCNWLTVNHSSGPIRRISSRATFQDRAADYFC